MKKFIQSIGIFVCSIALITACSDDRSNNPTLQEPTTFSLNTPAYAAQNINLALSDGINFTWSQPAYGFPVAAQYQLQVSLNDKYNISTSTALNDRSGKTIADYETLTTVYNSCRGVMNAENLSAALQRLAKYKEDNVPATQKVYARALSVLNNDTIYSNSITFNVVPHYVELKDADPEMWYLVGNCVGDGKWGNDAASIGTSLIPMFVKAGEFYDRVTGKGTIEYTGYFPAGGAFKIPHTPGNWDQDVVCSGFVIRQGGSDPGDISVAAAGYYTITMNTKSKTCTMDKVDITPAKYASITLEGTALESGSVSMTPVDTYAGAENHTWRANVTLVDGGLKFKSGSTAWGSDRFPYEVATTTGNEIPALAGKYLVMFNDINGAFYFFSR